MANYFMPSEVARLILGYFIERDLSKTMKTFLQECPDLTEFYQVMKSGRVPPTTIMGQSLMDMLNEFAELKLKGVRSGQLKVSTATSTECSTKERDAIISATQQSEEAIKRQRLQWKRRKESQAWRAREQSTTTLVGGSVGMTTPVSSCGPGVSTDVPVSTPRYGVIVGRTSTPTSSRIGNPEVISASVTNQVTIPGYTVSIPSHQTSPLIYSPSTSHCVANPQYTDTEPITSVVAIAQVENMTDVQTEVMDVPAAQTNLDTRLQLGLDAECIAGPSQAKPAAEENVEFFDWILEDTNFHEKLAENINKVLCKRGPTKLKNRVGTLSETNNKDLASMISKGFTIDQIIERTESDPSFQNFIQLFQQGTAVPLTQFDVPVIISSEVTTGQSGHVTPPTAAKTIQIQTDSCRSATVEPVNYQGDVSVLAPTSSLNFQSSNVLHSVAEQTSLLNPCEAERLDQELPCGIDAMGVSETSLVDVSVLAPTNSLNFQPSNVLHSVAEQTSLLNPCDAERLDQELPCGIDAMGVSETPLVDSLPMLKQMEAGDSYTQDGTDPLCHNKVSSNNFISTEDDSQNLTHPNLTSSLQLETSGFSQKCAESNLNSVLDQVAILDSAGSKKLVISENLCLQSSLLPAEKVTSRNSFVPPNENSLTVFSLIEKSIAEMHGEEFVHRSKRNSPFSQTAVSMDAHSSGVNGNEGGRHLSTVAVCDNTSKEDICCESIVKNSNEDHARTENCQDRDIKIGFNNIGKSTSINLNICSTQKASAFLTETATEKNVRAFQVGSPTDVRTNDPDERVLACITAIPVCDESGEPRPAFDNKRNDNGVKPTALCQNDYMASKKHGIDGSTGVSDTAVDVSMVQSASVNQEETRALFLQDNSGQAIIVSAPRNMRGTSDSLPKLSEPNKDNSTIGPGKKYNDNSSNSVCKENKQCSRNGAHNCTLAADCPVLRETDKMRDMEEKKTNARKTRAPDKELCVDNQEPFCMSPPLRRSGRLQQSMAQRHTKKTCINKQTEVIRSQSLCDCSAASNSLDGQNTTNGNSVNKLFEKHPIITSLPYFPLNVTDNNTHEQLSASIHPQTSCSSLPAMLGNVPAPGSPNFSQSYNASVKQVLEMTPPQRKQLFINSTEDNQTPPKTVKRRVIAFHSEHSPFIPDHCKKNPSRRIAPKEVDYSTPSPLQDCPSSPMSYMVDVSVSQPNSPLHSKEGVLRPLASGKTLPPLNGHIRINPQRSIEASCQNEKSSSSSGAQPQTMEIQQKVKTPDVCLSHLVKLGIKLPPSPSKREPRRIKPVQLSSINKDWSGVTRSSSFAPHGGYSPVVDESRIVSSTSDITSSTEEEAFRLLKSFLSSSYSKPQPRQEITSTYQKAGVSKCVHTPKSHSKQRGGGKKTPPVTENAVLTIEVNGSSISEENAFVDGDCGSTRRVQCLAESVLSCENFANKASNSGSVKEQPTVNLSHSKGNLPVKNSVYKVQCLHNATCSSVSPISRDSDMSFAPVGIMECFSNESDKQVPVTDSCKITTVGSSSSSCGTVCESTQNIPCLAKSKDYTSKGSSEILCTSGELCDYQNDISVHSKVYAETHKKTPETEQMRVAHSKVCAETHMGTPESEQMRVAHSKVCAETHKGTPETEQMRVAHSKVCAETHKSTPETEQMRVAHSKVCAETHTSTLETEQMRVAHSKVCAETHKSTPETEQMRVAHSKVCAETHKSTLETEQMRVTLASVDVDQVAINSTIQTKSADGHCLPVSEQGAIMVEKPTNNVETGAVGLVKNVITFSNTATLPTISIVANRAENKAFIPSISTGKSLSSPSSSEHHIATSAGSLIVKNNDPAVVSTWSHVTQLQSPKQHKHSNGTSPSAQSPNKLLNVSDSVTDAVYSLLSLCSGIDPTMATNIVSLSDENLSKNVGDNQVLQTEMLPMNNVDLIGHCPSTDVPISGSLLQVPMMTSDVSLPSFISSSLRLAHNIENTCEVPINFSSSLLKHYCSNLAGQEDNRSSENDHEVHINKERLRPCSPSSVSLLSKAMVDSGIPFDGSNLTVPDPWTSNGDGVCHELPVIHPQTPPDGLEAANANVNTESKKGRKPRSNAQKPDYRNVAKILPSLGVCNFELMERDEVDLVSSSSFVKILPRPPGASNAVLEPQATVTQPMSSFLSQIQMIPSANGPMIIIPPCLEGIFQKFLSENNQQSSQVSHTQNNDMSQPVSHIENNLPADNECMQPSNMESTSSCDRVQLPRAAKFKCVRKIAVRRRIDFTDLRSSRKGKRTKAKKKKCKASDVADCVSSVKQHHSSNVVVTSGIEGGKSLSFIQAPDIKQTSEIRRNCTDDAVQSEQTEVAYEVKSHSKDSVVQGKNEQNNDFVQGDLTDEVCELNIPNAQDGRLDKTKISCHVKKNGRNCSARSEKAGTKYEVRRNSKDNTGKSDKAHALGDDKSSYNSDGQKGKPGAVCEVKKSGRGDADKKDKQSVVCEVKIGGRCDADKSNKTPVVCDDNDRSNNYILFYDYKKNVVCDVKKSDTCDTNKSDTTDLAAKYNKVGKLVVSCKKTKNVNEKAGDGMSRSGENITKSSGDRLLLSGDKSEEISNKDISSRESPTVNNSSITVRKSAVSNMPILTELLHGENESNQGRNLEDREEIILCDDTPEKRTDISLKEHGSSVLNVKSSDSSKPSKNNSKVKAANRNKQQPATVEDSRKMKMTLPSCDNQGTISVSDPGSSHAKSTHTVPRKRKRKSTNPDVDQSGSKLKKIKLQVPIYKSDVDHSDSTFKKIKLQVPIDKPVKKECRKSTIRKSVRMFVDYSSGENIVVGNVPISENSDVLILSETEEEKKQCNILQASGQLKSKKFWIPVVKGCRIQNNIKVCNNNTVVNKCVTESGTAQAPDKKIESNGKTSAKPGECQYIGSLPFRSLFSIFDTVYAQGNQSSQSSLAPVDGTIKQSPKHLQRKRKDNPTVANKSRRHDTPKSRKTKSAAPSEKALSKHQGRTNTSDPTVPGTSRGCTVSQNRKGNSSAVSTGDNGRGKKPGFPRKQETCNRGNKTNTASLVDVDCVSSNKYDNETQDAVSAIELSMREETEYTHHFHKQPGPLCEVSSQVNISHSAVIILEDTMCQMSNTSPTEKSQPCHSNDASPIKLHLPPKKRLSSEFIVNGMVDTQFQHDQNSSVLSDSNSSFSVNKVTACWSHPISVGPSEVQDSSKPKTCSSRIEGGAACHELLAENRVLHSSQPTSLDHTSQTNLLSTGVSDKIDVTLCIPSETNVTPGIPSETNVTPGIPSETNVTQCIPSETNVTPGLPSETNGTPCIPSETNGTLCIPSETNGTPCIPSETNVTPCIPSETNVTPGIPSETNVTPGLPSETNGTPCIPSETNGTLCIPSETNGTPCIPSAEAAQLDEAHPASRHTMGKKVDKLLRKLHKKKNHL